MSLEHETLDGSRLFELLSNSSNRTYVYYSNIKEDWTRWSKSAVEYFGLSGEYLTPCGDEWAAKIHPEDRPLYDEDFRRMASHESPYHNCDYRITNASGEYVWINCRGYVTYDDGGNMEWFAGFVTNMGNRDKIDPVTSLCTVYEFRNYVQRLLDEGKSGGIMIIGLENFKRVNAEYGYDFGDKVLYTIGQKILGYTDNKTCVYRMDGAVYSIVMEDGDIADIIDMKNTIANMLELLPVGNQNLHLHVDTAATLFPADGIYIDQLQNNLFYALEQAKKLGVSDVVFYSEELYNRRNRIANMKEAICHSVANNFEGFRMVFQPIVDADTGTCVSAEALLRWSHKDFGNVSPMDFIPILEETKQIIPLGRWIIDESLRRLAVWYKEDGNTLKTINVNVSYIQFMDMTLRDYVVSKLDYYGLPHEALVLELTESCHVEQTDLLAQVLQSYKDSGITIALDDFGTGYASLSVLKDIPADIVKLDHTMTSRIVDKPKDRKLIEFIVMYCKKVNIRVCAEGVETDEALSIVQDAGAELIQGYYYDKPLEVEHFTNKYIA